MEKGVTLLGCMVYAPGMESLVYTRPDLKNGYEKPIRCLRFGAI
nr:hypothetical protein [uncultured Desulfobacter sp.]